MLPCATAACDSEGEPRALGLGPAIQLQLFTWLFTQVLPWPPNRPPPNRSPQGPPHSTTRQQVETPQQVEWGGVVVVLHPRRG